MINKIKLKSNKQKQNITKEQKLIKQGNKAYIICSLINSQHGQ